MVIKLQDFARQQGVTDRAIQKHLNTYAKELEGLYERKGPNGTWLSEEACEILRSKMKQNPVVLVDAEQQQEVEELRKRVSFLQDKLIEFQEKHISYVEHTTDLLNAAAETQKLLEASNKAQEALRADLSNAEGKVKELTIEAEEARREALEGVQRADEAERELDQLKKRSFWQRLLNK